MKKSIQLMLIGAIALLGSAGLANATLIQFNATLQNSSDNDDFAMFVPKGGIITLDLLLDIPAGTPSELNGMSFPIISGQASWNNGGLQQHPFILAVSAGGRSTGDYFFEWDISPIVIGNFLFDDFDIEIRIGENPFTSTSELTDLLLNNGAFIDVGTVVREQGQGFKGVDLTLLSSSITAGVAPPDPVPLPTALSLILVGGAGLGWVHRRRNRMLK